jgi:hypothetical protein
MSPLRLDFRFSGLVCCSLNTSLSTGIKVGACSRDSSLGLTIWQSEGDLV